MKILHNPNLKHLRFDKMDRNGTKRFFIKNYAVRQCSSEYLKMSSKIADEEFFGDIIIP